MTPSRWPRRFAGATTMVLLSLALLVACGRSGADEATPSTTTTRPATTTTTEPPNSTTTGSSSTTTSTTSKPVADKSPPPPNEITPANLTRVLDRLHGLFRQALAIAKAENAFGERYFAAMGTVFTPDAADGQTEGLEEFGGLAVVARTPGQPSTREVEILHADAKCVLLSADIDLDPLVLKPINARQPYFVKLVATDTSAQNPTPWLIDYESFTRDRKPPRNKQCPS